MTKRHTKQKPDRPGARPLRPVLAVAAAVFAVALAVATGEILLRVLPIPGIELQPFYYDENTGGKLYPGTTLTYRSTRGDRVARHINSWGFLDVEHDVPAAPGTTRIGFFGDSYTEARQVPIDDTFFRVVERDLNWDSGPPETLPSGTSAPPPFEVLAFGVAGRSTVQSWFECRNWMEQTSLDYVVYVFCENDPGDQLKAVSQADVAPFASLQGDSLVIDTSFRDTYRHKGSRLYRAGQYLKSHSYLVSTIVSRLKLLRRHGVQLPPSGDGAGAAGVTIMGPASWPSDSLATYGWDVTEHVIARWRDEVERSGRRFVILRVPREIELSKPLEEQDAFAPRLHEFCAARGIELIDPTPELLAGLDAGDEMYFDHFTPRGHRAVASAFVAWFRQHATEDRWN